MIPFRVYFYVGVIAAIVVGVLLYRHSLIAEGEAIRDRENFAAKAVLDAQVKADEQILQAAVEKAATERKGVQKTLDAYMATHNSGSVWLCPPNTRSAGLPQAPGAGSGAAHPGAGPTAIPEVPRRDVSGNLHTLVRAAATVDGLYRSRQQVTP